MIIIRYSAFVILILVFSCERKGKKNTAGIVRALSVKENIKDPVPIPIEPYDYDTVLKGGYKILMKFDDSLEYLYLARGEEKTKIIASCTKGLPYKNLGYKAADFPNYFVLAHSYGSGNPNYIELIDKATGKNNLEYGAIWIDVNESKNLLLYCTNSTPTNKDVMTLYNIKSGSKYCFTFPKKFLKKSIPLSHVHIDTVMERNLLFD